MTTDEAASRAEEGGTLTTTLLQPEYKNGDMCDCWFTRGSKTLCGDVLISPLQIAFTVFLTAMFAYVIIDFLTVKDLLKLAEVVMGWLEGTAILWVLLFFIVFTVVWLVCMGFTSVACICIGFVLKTRWTFWVALTFGTFTAFVASSLGNLTAFALGRTILYPCAHALVLRHKYLEGLDLAIYHHGAKMNVLLRLAPIIPFALLNYLMGVTSTTVADFCIGFFGGVPYLVAFVYLGTLVGSASGIGDSLNMSSTDWLLICGGGVAVLVVFTWYLYSYTKEELKVLMASAHHIEQEMQAGNSPPGGPGGYGTRRESFAAATAGRRSSSSSRPGVSV